MISLFAFEHLHGHDRYHTSSWLISALHLSDCSKSVAKRVILRKIIFDGMKKRVNKKSPNLVGAFSI
jgi:hypothetical protein